MTHKEVILAFVTANPGAAANTIVAHVLATQGNALSASGIRDILRTLGFTHEVKILIYSTAETYGMLYFADNTELEIV